MIKKSIALSLALLYTVAVLGFAINFHYCLNHVSSVKINEPVKMCGAKRMAKALKCCKDKNIEVKVKDGHQSSSLSFLAKSVAFDLPRISYIEFSPNLTETAAVAINDRGPPDGLSSQPSIFLSNRNFRI